VDPSPGVLLVPVGALALLAAVGLIAWSATRPDGPEGTGAKPEEAEEPPAPP
jgi:hypothetical protein